MTERECSSTPLFRGRSQQCCLLALFPVARQKRERGGGGGGTEKKNARHISGKQMLRNAKFLRAAVLCFPKAFKALNGAEKYSPTAQCRRATLFFASIITVNCSLKKGKKKVLHHVKAFVQPDVQEILRGLNFFGRLVEIIPTKWRKFCWMSLFCSFPLTEIGWRRRYRQSRSIKTMDYRWLVVTLPRFCWIPKGINKTFVHDCYSHNLLCAYRPVSSICRSLFCVACKAVSFSLSLSLLNKPLVFYLKIFFIVS